jgi:hypothetical protein
MIVTNSECIWNNNKHVKAVIRALFMSQFCFAVTCVSTRDLIAQQKENALLLPHACVTAHQYDTVVLCVYNDTEAYPNLRCLLHIELLVVCSWFAALLLYEKLVLLLLLCTPVRLTLSENQQESTAASTTTATTTATAVLFLYCKCLCMQHSSISAVGCSAMEILQL